MVVVALGTTHQATPSQHLPLQARRSLLCLSATTSLHHSHTVHRLLTRHARLTCRRSPPPRLALLHYGLTLSTSCSCPPLLPQTSPPTIRSFPFNTSLIAQKVTRNTFMKCPYLPPTSFVHAPSNLLAPSTELQKHISAPFTLSRHPSPVSHLEYRSCTRLRKRRSLGDSIFIELRRSILRACNAYRLIVMPGERFSERIGFSYRVVYLATSHENNPNHQDEPSDP